MNLNVQSLSTLSPRALNLAAAGGLTVIAAVGGLSQVGATPHPAQPAPADEPHDAPVVAAAAAPGKYETVAPAKPQAALNSAQLTSWPLTVGQWRKVTDNGTDGSGYAIYQKGEHRLRLSYGPKASAAAVAADQIGAHERPAATGTCGELRDGGQVTCYLRADQGAVVVRDVANTAVGDAVEFADQLVPAVGTVQQ